MLKSFKINCLLFFSLFLLSSCAFAQTSECDSDNRPTDCSDLPDEPSCGYYTNNCPLEVCGKAARSGCEACSYPDILYYKKEACQDEEIVLSCGEQTCSPTLEHAFDPVCGLKLSQDGILMVQNFDNECKLCSDEFFSYYQRGPCENFRGYCENPDHEDDEEGKGGVDREDWEGEDPYSSSFVCAYFTSGNTGRYTTFSSRSEACSDQRVEYWFWADSQECGQWKDGRIFCLPSNRPEACPNQGDPVCGFYYDEAGELAHKIMGNGCSACAEHDILWYTPGPCVFECNIDPELDYGCAGSLMPVCATYEEDGEEGKVSLQNDCIACKYQKGVKSYVDGLCPGDEGIRCENTQKGDVEVEGQVCAYSAESCDSDACRETYAAASLACEDSSVIWYSIGPCPEGGS